MWVSSSSSAPFHYSRVYVLSFSVRSPPILYSVLTNVQVEEMTLVEPSSQDSQVMDHITPSSTQALSPPLAPLPIEDKTEEDVISTPTAVEQDQKKDLKDEEEEEEEDTWGTVSEEKTEETPPTKTTTLEEDSTPPKDHHPPSTTLLTKFYNGPRDPSLPPSQVSHRIFASNLSFETGWLDLKAFMDEIGHVVYIDILTTQGGSKSKVLNLLRRAQFKHFFCQQKKMNNPFENPIGELENPKIKKHTTI